MASKRRPIAGEPSVVVFDMRLCRVLFPDAVIPTSTAMELRRSMSEEQPAIIQDDLTVHFASRLRLHSRVRVEQPGVCWNLSR